MNPIAEAAFETMERHLTGATADLFDCYGMALTACEPGSSGELEIDEQSVLAFIGYAGDKVRGAMVMVTSRSAVETWVTKLGGDTEADVADTLGEFSNMLLGRLKARLIPEGFPILLSTPTTACGLGLRLSRAVRPSSVFSFNGPGWRLGVRIDATFEEGFALQAGEDRSDAAGAGDMMLF